MHLPLLAQLEDNCLGSRLPPFCCCLGCFRGALADRSGRLWFRRAQSSDLRLRWRRRQEEATEEETLQTGSGSHPLACNALERTLREVIDLPYTGYLMLLLLFDHRIISCSFFFPVLGTLNGLG